MPDLQEVPIAPPPGVVKSNSLRVIEGRWSDVINMRFVQDKPQKIGGWTKQFATPTLGTPRTLHAWRDVFFNAYFGVGTYAKLYVYDQNKVQFDVTPIRATGTLTNPYTTGAYTDPLTSLVNMAVVKVTHTAHGLSIGDLIYLSGGTAVGGIIPSAIGTPVNSVIDNNNYTFLNAVAATSAAGPAGGTVTYSYEIPIGVELGTYGYGYGVGGFGLTAWDTARLFSTIVIEPRVWSLDHFGKFLLGSYNGGSIYYFDPTQAQPWTGRALLISADGGLPTNVRAMFVTPERYIMALCDNMQVAWPDQGSMTVWTPAISNTANIRTLTEGSKLVAGRVLADFVSLVWTDAALYRFQYTGSTYVYASSMVAKDCGLVSPNAAVTIGGIAYWMGQTNFWTYNGSVIPMTNVNDIRKWVYDVFDINLGYQCNASYVPVYNEVWFFFTLKGQINPTQGLIYSIDQSVWAPLYWGRAGGAHYTQGDTSPIFGGTDFFLYLHEYGNDADGSVLSYSMTLAPYAMTKGARYNMNVEYLVPDFFQQIGDISLTMESWDRLNDSGMTEIETDTITATNSGTIDLRLNGRYIAMVMANSSLGSYARLGLPVVFIRPAGDRT